MNNTISYSDTADGLSRMSKDEFEKIFKDTYFKYKRNIALLETIASILFYTGVGIFFFLIGSTLWEHSPFGGPSPFKYYSLLGILFFSLIIASVSLIVSEEFFEKDVITLQMAAPEEAERIKQEIMDEESKIIEGKRLKAQLKKEEKAEKRKRIKEEKTRIKYYKRSVNLAEKLKI